MKYNVYVQDIFVAEELVKQGYATWEWDPAEDQMNVGAQLGQVPTDITETASSGTKSNTLVEGRQSVIESGECKETKLEAQITGIRPLECCLDEY